MLFVERILDDGVPHLLFWQVIISALLCTETYVIIIMAEIAGV